MSELPDTLRDRFATFRILQLKPVNTIYLKALITQKSAVVSLQALRNPALCAWKRTARNVLGFWHHDILGWVMVIVRYYQPSSYNSHPPLSMPFSTGPLGDFPTVSDLTRNIFLKLSFQLIQLGTGGNFDITEGQNKYRDIICAGVQPVGSPMTFCLNNRLCKI